MSLTFNTTLRTRPEYFTSTLKLIESAFAYESENKFEIDFAPLIAKNNWENLHIVVDKENNQVICHVGLILKTFENKNYSTPIIFLGAIATDPKYRGKGHLKQLLNHIIALHHDHVSMFMLWSDIDDLYKKFNFHRSGMQFQIGNENFEYQTKFNYLKTKFNYLDQAQWSQIKQLYNQYQQANDLLMPRRTQSDWDNISFITSSDLYLKYDEKQNLEAYFCVNKGQDLTGIIHECIAQSSSSPIYKELSRYKLWLPSLSFEVSNTAETLSLALVRIGNKNLFKSLVSYWSQNKIKILDLNESEIQFEFNGDAYQIGQAEFLNALFGPEKATEFQAFKLSFYISGLDSV